MEYLTVLGMVINAGPGIFKHFERQRAKQAAWSYLEAKYTLPVPDQRTMGSGFLGHSTSWRLTGRWEQAVRDVCRGILSHELPSESCCILCGDLGLFITVTEYFDSSDQLMKDFEKLKKADTYQSLLEMGRGRGADYALKLIKQELRQCISGI